MLNICLKNGFIFLSICMPASEMRYREPRIDKKTLCIFVSQSGETADTLAGFKTYQRKKG